MNRSRIHFGYMLQSFVNGFLGTLQVLQTLFEIGIVGSQVELSVTAETYDDTLLLVLLFAAQCFVNGRANRVRRLRFEHEERMLTEQRWVRKNS